MMLVVVELGVEYEFCIDVLRTLGQWKLFIRIAVIETLYIVKADFTDKIMTALL